MSRISLSQANQIIVGALAKGAEAGFKPLSVAVVDAGGHVIACLLYTSPSPRDS